MTLDNYDPLRHSRVSSSQFFAGHRDCPSRQRTTQSRMNLRPIEPVVAERATHSDQTSGAPEILTRRDDQMEAYRIERFSSVDGIVLRSSEDPRAGPKEILMGVRASALNYRDLMVLKGSGRVRRRSASCHCPTARARSRQSAKALRGSKLAIGLPAAFIRVGLADRSSPSIWPMDLAPIPSGCWRNTQSSTKRRSSLCQAISPSREPRHCRARR
jgi:hypothetical protein